MYRKLSIFVLLLGLWIIPHVVSASSISAQLDKSQIVSYTVPNSGDITWWIGTGDGSVPSSLSYVLVATSTDVEMYVRLTCFSTTLGVIAQTGCTDMSAITSSHVVVPQGTTPHAYTFNFVYTGTLQLSHWYVAELNVVTGGQQVAVYGAPTVITATQCTYNGVDNCIGTPWYSYNGRVYASNVNQAAGYASTTLFDEFDDVASDTAPLVVTSCPFSFSTTWLQCVFIPDVNSVYYLIDKMKTSVLNKAPWGYLTRIYNVVETYTSTSTLPSLAITFPSYILPVGMGSTTIDFTPWNSLMGSGSIIANLNAPTGGTFLSKAEYYFDILITILFGFWLMRKVLKIFHASVPSRRRS